MIKEKLLGERYRFKEASLPENLGETERDARIAFMEEIHSRGRYSDTKSCPFCGGSGFTKISEVNKRGLPSEIVICDTCDACFKSKLLDSAANKYYYENISYNLRGKRSSLSDLEECFNDRVNNFAYQRYRFIRHFVRMEPSDGIVIELGCNDGANLMPWKKDGFEVQGIDLDPKMVEFGKGKGLNIVRGDLMSGELLSGKRPKLIMLSHVLGHVSDAHHLFDMISDALRPDGYIFIETPNIRTHGPVDPMKYFDMEFNYCFDTGSLNRLLDKHGFKNLYEDEYTRVICTPVSNNRGASYAGDIGLSPDKVAAGLYRFMIEAMRPIKTKLYYMLKAGESGRLRARLLASLYNRYFRHHYRSIERA